MACLVGAGARIGLHALLQFLAGAEGHDGARGDRNLLARLGVAPRALVLASQVEVAEARKLHLATGLERFAERVEERVDEFLRLAFVEADFVEQTFGHFRFGQRHPVPLDDQARMTAPCSACSAEITSATACSTSRSVRVRDSSWRIKPIARLLNPDSTPAPAYTSKTRRSLRTGPAAAFT